MTLLVADAPPVVGHGGESECLECGHPDSLAPVRSRLWARLTRRTVGSACAHEDVTQDALVDMVYRCSCADPWHMLA